MEDVDDAEGVTREPHTSFLQNLAAKIIDLTDLGVESDVPEEEEGVSYTSSETAQAQSETADELGSDSAVNQEEEASEQARTARFQYDGGMSFVLL